MVFVLVQLSSHSLIERLPTHIADPIPSVGGSAQTGPGIL